MNYYDEGWNAYIAKIPYNIKASLDWKDGWKDCQEATEKSGIQKPI